MDIQLSDGLSFEIFKHVDVNCPVIFTTAYDEYALQAFKVNSIDYLLKPINKEDLAKSLQKWEQLKQQFSGSIDSSVVENLLVHLSKEQQRYKSRFLLKSGQAYTSISVDNVAYFFSDRKLTFLMTHGGKKFIIDEPLEKLEKQLDPYRFFRLNRSFLASLDSIASVHKFFNGKLKIDLRPYIDNKVLVSREKVTAFKQWLDQ